MASRGGRLGDRDLALGDLARVVVEVAGSARGSATAARAVALEAQVVRRRSRAAVVGGIVVGEAVVVGAGAASAVMLSTLGATGGYSQ